MITQSTMRRRFHSNSAVHNNTSSRSREGTGLRLAYDQLRSSRIRLARKGKPPVSHPSRRLRHVHTTLWQGCPSCRQKLHERLLGCPGKGPGRHLQRPLGTLRHPDERDCPDDIQPVRPCARPTLLRFALTLLDPVQERLRRDYGDFGQAAKRQRKELEACFQSTHPVSGLAPVYR